MPLGVHRTSLNLFAQAPLAMICSGSQGPHNSRAKAFYFERNDSAIILYARELTHLPRTCAAAILINMDHFGCDGHHAIKRLHVTAQTMHNHFHVAKEVCQHTHFTHSAVGIDATKHIQLPISSESTGLGVELTIAQLGLLRRPARAGIPFDRLFGRTVQSNYVYRTVKTCKWLKRDVHEQMWCGYHDSTINTNSSTAFAANHLKMVLRRCKHPTRLHIEPLAASIYSWPYFSRQSVAGCEICV